MARTEGVDWQLGTTNEKEVDVENMPKTKCKP